jgi:N-acetylneuraminic acid mutarotase
MTSAAALRLVLPALLALAGTAAAILPARFERRASMGVPRQEIGVTAIGRTLYALGGFDAAGAARAVVEGYDTVADQWTTLAPLPAPVHHPMAAAVDGRVYSIGGLTGGSFAAVTAVHAYDPATNAWTPRAPLPAARGAGGVAVIDGRVYVVGGFRNGGSVDDLAVYDPSADVWTTLPPMPTARDHLAAAAIGGRLYAVGGRAGGVLFAALEVFEPATGAWLPRRAPMPTARGGLAAAALGGRLFTFGGEGNAGDPQGIFPETEGYDPARDAWFALPDMGVPRHGTAAVAVDGAIHLVGGATRQGFGASGASEVFVPSASDVLTLGRLRAPGRTRLALRGRLVDSGGEDPAALEVRLRLLDGEREVFAVAAPAGSLVPTRHGTRWRLRRFPRTAGPRFTRLVLRRRADGDLVAHIGAVPRTDLPSGTEATVVVDLGARSFCALARLR